MCSVIRSFPGAHMPQCSSQLDEVYPERCDTTRPGPSIQMPCCEYRNTEQWTVNTHQSTMTISRFRDLCRLNFEQEKTSAEAIACIQAIFTGPLIGRLLFTFSSHSAQRQWYKRIMRSTIVSHTHRRKFFSELLFCVMRFGLNLSTVMIGRGMGKTTHLRTLL